jgi:hypothetical protein
MCLELRFGLGFEIDPRSVNSWIEKFTLEPAESVLPLALPFVYRISGRDDGCACLLMDGEGYRMDRDSAINFRSARRDLARLLRGWAVRCRVEIVAYWLGEEMPSAPPLTVSVNRLINKSASFRGSGTPYYYLVKAQPALLQ